MPSIIVMLKKLSLFVIFTFCLLFFSYRITEVPSGLTGDEAAFGYNAILLSRNLRDENNRFLPIFVLSLDGKDWRQPITQYLIAAYFKLFGPSVRNLRMTSVLIISLSVVLIFILADALIDKSVGLLALLFFMTTPIIMIQSHLALDNIAPIPFIIVWLICLFNYEKSRNYLYLILSALSLGVSFYSYKAMRSFVPVWSIDTVLYLAIPYIKKRSRENLFKIFKPIFIFAIFIAPFFAVIPFLEFKYAGAVVSGVGIKDFGSIYKFIYYYISSYDPSFLFIAGDEIITHSTHTHGMLLLASLPFFLAGVRGSLRRNMFWKFLLLVFFTGPLLIGFATSYHRASRLISLVPIYSVICALGAYQITRSKYLGKALVTILFGLLFINYFDFINYYWYQYDLDYKHTFNSVQIGQAYKYLNDGSNNEHLLPYIDLDIIDKEDTTASFLRSIYFDESLRVWNGKYEDLPGNALLMSKNSNIYELQKIGSGEGGMYFYIKNP